MFPPHHYPPDSAPDKGAVGFLLEGQKLLVSSLHLTGTNKYGVPEMNFDNDRRRQLDKISKAIETSFDNYPPEELETESSSAAPTSSSFRVPLSYYRKVIMGDLNFRCELFPSVEDKAKGGRDFAAVNEVAMSGESDALESLFFAGDRLQRWLRMRGVWSLPEVLPRTIPQEPDPQSFGPPEEPIPSILQATEDALPLTRSLVKVRRGGEFRNLDGRMRTWNNMQNGVNMFKKIPLAPS